MPSVTGMRYTSDEGAEALWGYFLGPCADTLEDAREDIDTVQLFSRPNPTSGKKRKFMWADLVIEFANDVVLVITPVQMAREMTAIASDPTHEYYESALGELLRDGKSWLRGEVQVQVLDVLVDMEVSA